MAAYIKDMEQLKKKHLDRSIKHASLKMDEAFEDHGEDSGEFRHAKCEYETQLTLMWLIDENYKEPDYK